MQNFYFAMNVKTCEVRSVQNEITVFRETEPSWTHLDATDRLRIRF